MSEGRVDWDAGWTWYRVDGDLGEDGPAPLVILHGGPGVGTVTRAGLAPDERLRSHSD